MSLIPTQYPTDEVMLTLSKSVLIPQSTIKNRINERRSSDWTPRSNIVRRQVYLLREDER